MLSVPLGPILASRQIYPPYAVAIGTLAACKIPVAPPRLQPKPLPCLCRINSARFETTWPVGQ